MLDEVEEVKGIMHDNIGVMLQNHEKVENLQDKTGTTSIAAILLSAYTRNRTYEQ